jgi:hypothetical protein
LHLFTEMPRAVVLGNRTHVIATEEVATLVFLAITYK